MTPTHSDNGVSRLRVVTQRISVTPTWQLPHIVKNLAILISESGSQLRLSNQDGSKQGSDHVTLLHKYKTQLSTLLQDRSPKARFTAVVLVKATIEAGHSELLKESGRWVGSLISILGKSDPSPTKKICVLTMTRIFTLSHHDQQIVREVTTPALPGFITACLKLLANAEDFGLSTMIIQALLELLPRHPASFRPFVAQIQLLLTPYIASTPSNLDYGPRDEKGLSVATAPQVYQCRCLYVRLTSCAAKDKSGEEWTKLLNAAIHEVHFTCDRVFRAFEEDWSGADHLKSHVRDHDPGDLSQIAQCAANGSLSLPPWRGIVAGMERLDGLLNLLQCFLICATSSAVTLPVGSVLDVILRILYVAVLEDHVNPAVDRNERELLRISLPSIQSSTLDLSALLIRRLGHGSAGFVPGIFEPVFSASARSWSSDKWRKAYARFLTQVLDLFGPSMLPYLSAPLSHDISRFCSDALASCSLDQVEPARSHTVVSYNTKSAIDTDDEVLILSRTALLRLPSTYLTGSARKDIERFAILSGDKEALLAATLNPRTKQKARRQNPSLLPFLTREHQHAPETEALIRPRMVPVVGSSRSLDQIYGHEEDDVRVDEYEMTFGQINPTHDPGGATHIEDSLESPQQRTDTQAEPQSSSLSGMSTSATINVETRMGIQELEPLDNPASPAKRPYAESQGAYTLYTPSGKSALEKLDSLDDDPPPGAEIPSAKKPRLEEQQQSEPKPGSQNRGTENKAVETLSIDNTQDPGNESEDSPIPTIYTSSDEDAEDSAGDVFGDDYAW